MVGWTIVMTGIKLTGVGVVFTCKQHQAGQIAYWQQHQAAERRMGGCRSVLPDAIERHQTMDHAPASMKPIDVEVSRLTGSQGESVTTPQQPGRAHLDETHMGGLQKVEGERCVMLHETERRSIAYACKTITL